MFRLRGGSAVDVARQFWLLWNDPTPLPLGTRFIYTIKPYPWSTPAPQAAPVGKLTVQTVRTIGCKAAVSGMYQKPVSTAPKGEYSFLAQFTKMARNARKYIYLEDRFAFMLLSNYPNTAPLSDPPKPRPIVPPCRMRLAFMSIT